MGSYMNPGKEKFVQCINSEIYIDKTGLIRYCNKVMNSLQKYISMSRPRRFGKSVTADMLAAYYSRGCDCGDLFAGLEIAEDEHYTEHMNRYNVLFLNMQEFLSRTDSMEKMLELLKKRVIRDMMNEYPQADYFDPQDLIGCMQDLYDETKSPFVIIIDEWDCIFREYRQEGEAQKLYLDFLRDMLKDKGYIALCYMTGILPIKKDGSQSAISEFDEYSMVKPLFFDKYVGFTEDEVRCLCEKNDVDFKTMKQWYDGYVFRNVGSVYNPNSVMKSIRFDEFDSYWTETSAAEGLMDYISKGYKALTRTIAELIGGVAVKVSITGFANDLTTFRGRDDVLTLMIHLGYLAYDAENQTVRIPNEEIKLEFQKAVREVKHEATIKRLEESDQLFFDTIHEKADAVAAQIEKIHMEETVPLHYNKEDSLRSVIKLAYYTYRDHYVQFEELPGGEGFADVVYFPRHDSDWPTLVIELKWNKSARGAIDQILNKKYANVAENFGTDILLVGVNYEKDAPPGKRKHTCSIVRYKAK